MFSTNEERVIRRLQDKIRDCELKIRDLERYINELRTITEEDNVKICNKACTQNS
jgi:hypothetical protein